MESKDKQNSLMEQSLVVEHSKEIERGSEKECSSGKEGSNGKECSIVLLGEIANIRFSVTDCFKDSFTVLVLLVDLKNTNMCP